MRKKAKSSLAGSSARVARCCSVASGHKKNGHGRYWIKLDVPSYDSFRADLEVKGVALKDDFWGFDTLVVEDLDGNELFFPVPKPETS